MKKTLIIILALISLNVFAQRDVTRDGGSGGKGGNGGFSIEYILSDEYIYDESDCSFISQMEIENPQAICTELQQRSRRYISYDQFQYLIFCCEKTL